MTTKPKKFPIVYLEWGDASSIASWTSNEEVDMWLEANHKDVGWAINVGWLIRETDKYIVIASRKAPDSAWQDEQWGNLQKIPKTWIKNRKTLKL